MSIARHHAEWLSLVPVSGPFLSLPVLMEAFNAGLEPHDPEHVRLLRQEYANWEESFEKRKADPAPHQHWIKFVLNKTLDQDDQVLVEGQAIPQTLHVEVPEHHELLRPSIVLNDPVTRKARLLIQTYPRSQELTSYVASSPWKASPDTRMTELLHGTGVRLGLVTNGEHWMFVDAPKGETTGYASWYSSLWLEEPITLRAFRTLLSAGRFFGEPEKTLESLLTKSASNQQEVTDWLGYQVRRAVEVLIYSLDRADQDFGRALLADVTPEQLYESALTVMMRLVFLFCAEERELIPSKPFPVYEQNYSVSTISKQLRELADQHGEELLERRYDAWPRLLAAFRSVYGGLKHDDVHIPAYGGNLFNPDRFPFLEGRRRGTSWRNTEASPLPVNNRTVLHLLEALQLLQIKVQGGGPAEARRLSFRALDIEQIGHVYEGLLDHTAKRATEPFLGLAGSRDKEPEISLAELEKLHAKGEADLVKFLKEETGKKENALKKALDLELDTQQAARLRTACQGDSILWKRVEPLAGLIRPDSFGYPVVIPKGSVFVTAGTDRRSSGTHYTPRSLTEPITQYTLEPLVYVGPAEGKSKSEWKLKSAKELLDLKICDMACGSGAFLVQAARYMSERLLETWDQAKKAHPTTPGITPEGMPSTGKAIEALIPDEPAERKTYAMRIIAQRCLYGVDKNPLAAEMAKLSMWLLTLAKDKPFEFLDHSIRCGDSLVGLHSIDQLRHFSMKPNDLDQPMFSGPWLDGVPEAIELRLKLEDMPANTVEDVQRQEELLVEANEKIARLRCAADLLVAAEFWGENPKDKLERTRHAAVKSGYYVDKGPTEEFEQVAAEERRAQLTFHWPLEFPEVIVKRGGFDAFLGNPPFMGGKKITGTLGAPYRNHILAWLAEGQRGHADLCAYFFLRAKQVLREGGEFGLLATNTIAQGDTREVGLQQLTSKGCIIPRAVPSRRWPGTASLEVAHVWVRKGTWSGPFVLDEMPTNGITAFLTPPGTIAGNPYCLKANESKSFIGSYVLGMGFVLEPEEALSLIERDPRYKDVLFPYLNGEDINSRPDQSPSRWVINFFDWPIERAKEYPDCFRIIDERVKPERTRKNDKDEFVLRKPLPQKWWIYGDKRPELYRTIAGMQQVLVGVLHTKYWSVTSYSPSLVFSHALAVFAVSDFGYLAVLESFLHESWAREYSGSLETRLRYTPSDCFDTFPFPAKQAPLGIFGERYHELRCRIMLAHGEGLTKIYNRFHNPVEESADIQNLRQLHVEMDRAVATAYDWTDLDLGHDFHETKQGIRFAISEPARREVLQRLLSLNHERYAEEVKQGLHGKAKPKKIEIAAKPAKPKSKVTVPPATLFDMDEHDTAFPNTERDMFLCGLVCDLVAVQPGLKFDDYLDQLVITLGYQKHKRLLSGSDRTRFAKLCKAIPVASGAQSIPWEDLKSVLSLRKALIIDGTTIKQGPDLNHVRTSYPSTDTQMVSLIAKAASALRELKELAQPSGSEEAKVLGDFEQDRRAWCGAAA